MGATFLTMKAKGTPAEVKAQFEDEQAQDRHENGHSYSGGFGMARGLVFPKTAPFPGEETASAWLDENCQKWGPAVAVPLMPASDNVWLIGAVCAL
jgi:hypothetical protein